MNCISSQIHSQPPKRNCPACWVSRSKNLYRFSRLDNDCLVKSPNLEREPRQAQGLVSVATSYQTLHSLGIGFIATEYKEKNIPTGQLTDSFRKSFYQAAIRYIIAKEPTLELFNGKIFNDIIAKYKQISAKFEETTQRELFARLAPTFRLSLTKPSKVPKWVSFKRISATMPAAYLFASYSTRFPLCCRACAVYADESSFVAQFIRYGR